MRFPNPQLARQWQDRLDRFDDSGLTVAEFCDLEGYSPASFYQWRRKLRTGEPSGVPAFLPVALDSRDLPTQSVETFRIELPGGSVIKIPSGATAAEQRNLIRAILEATAEVAS